MLPYAVNAPLTKLKMPAVIRLRGLDLRIDPERHRSSPPHLVEDVGGKADVVAAGALAHITLVELAWLEGETAADDAPVRADPAVRRLLAGSRACSTG